MQCRRRRPHRHHGPGFPARAHDCKKGHRSRRPVTAEYREGVEGSLGRLQLNPRSRARPSASRRVVAELVRPISVTQVRWTLQGGPRAPYWAKVQTLLVPLALQALAAATTCSSTGRDSPAASRQCAQPLGKAIHQQTRGVWRSGATGREAVDGSGRGASRKFVISSQTTATWGGASSTAGDALQFRPDPSTMPVGWRGC